MTEEQDPPSFKVCNFDSVQRRPKNATVSNYVAAESMIVLNNVISIFQAARRRDRERLLQLEEEGTDLELELRYVGIIFYPLGIFS